MKLINELLAAKYNSKYNFETNTSTLLNAFESLVLTNPDISSNKVMKELSIKNVTNYKALKHRLEKKLINDLFIKMENWDFIDQRDQAKPMVAKLYIISLAQLKSGRRSLAVVFLEKALGYSLKYDFLDICESICKTLMMHYSINEINEVKSNYYTQLLNTSSFKNYKETIITTNYAYVNKVLIQNTGKIPETKLNEIGNISKQMEIVNEEINTYISQLYTYDVKYSYSLAISDYKCALESSFRFKRYLDTNPNANSKLNSFILIKNLGIAYFNLKDYAKAGQYFKDAESQVNLRTNYWAYVTSFQFINFSHAGDYQAALNITIEALNNKHLKLHPMFEELWKIREAYMHLLIRTEKVSLNSQQKEKIRPFSLNKFLNDVPFYSKDKTGANINIIILQIQFLFLERKYNLIIDRKEALEKYSQRYIVKNKYFRAQCFINMVLTAIKCNFHPVRTKTLAQKYIIKLNTHALELNENEPTIEIIPYDKQWEILMELMVRNVGK